MRVSLVCLFARWLRCKLINKQQSQIFFFSHFEYCLSTKRSWNVNKGCWSSIVFFIDWFFLKKKVKLENCFCPMWFVTRVYSSNNKRSSVLYLAGQAHNTGFYCVAYWLKLNLRKYLYTNSQMTILECNSTRKALNKNNSLCHLQEELCVTVRSFNVLQRLKQSKTLKSAFSHRICLHLVSNNLILQLTQPAAPWFVLSFFK